MARSTRYYVYRNGEESIEGRIKVALQHYYERHRRLPAAVIVPRPEVDVAQEALKALGVKLAAEGNGGCLMPEVWLPLEEESA